jgi:MraZ protein
MFTGRYETTFSGKNRLVLPRNIRLGIFKQRQLVLTEGKDGEIWGFRKTDWEVEARRRLEIPISEDQGREIRRDFFIPAEVVTMDKQSRFVIPQHLVDFAKLSTDILILGAGDHFEIWDKPNWIRFKSIRAGK